MKSKNESKTKFNELETKLKEFKGIQGDLERQLADVSKKAEGLALTLAKEEVGKIHSLIDAFAKLFTEGTVYKAFEEIREHLQALQSYEKNYQRLYQAISPYGGNRTKDSQWLVSFILDYWGPDANLWDILKRIYNTRYQEGNFFINPKEKEK